MPDPSPSLLMVAGEASGDLHGSKVVRRLLDRAPDLAVYGVGGDRMGSAGMELVFRSDDFAMVGFVEILRHVPRLKRAMDELVRLVRSRGTRAAILIDYPGFNLMLARRLRDAGVRVLYYISPQVWAWGEGRVAKIAERVERMAVVFRFEEDFYRERGVEAEFVGHPLLEEPWIAAIERPRPAAEGPPILGLLPGSRRQEVLRHLPPMLDAARLLSDSIDDLVVRVGLASGIDASTAETAGDAIGRSAEIVPRERVHELISRSTALLVSSGTATLEAACAGTPMVIIYRMAPLSYLLGRMLVRIPNIGLVNVVAGEKVVPELIQNEASPGNLAEAIRPFITDRDLAARTSRALLAVRDRLGAPGASDRVARMALSMVGGA